MPRLVRIGRRLLDPEDEDAAGDDRLERDPLEVALERREELVSVRHVAVGLRVLVGETDPVGRVLDHPEAIEADAGEPALVDERRADDLARGRYDAPLELLESPPRPLEIGAHPCGVTRRTLSMPGMSGKPPKSTNWLNLLMQVVPSLLQPALTVRTSPGRTS